MLEQAKKIFLIMPRRLVKKKKNWKKLQGIGLVLFLVALGLGAVWRYGQDKIGEPAPQIFSAPEAAALVDEKSPCQYISWLNGICVGSASEVSPRLIGVIIENHPESRPPSGLSAASIVYEAPVEANYTRFLAFYPVDAQVEKVGPVRSLRPYFIDWLEEYNRPLLFHVGGSPAALDKAEARGILNLNEFYRGWYYWRSRDRGAPHNVYTSSELWARAYKDYGTTAEALATSTWQFATSSEPCSRDKVFSDDEKIIGGPSLPDDGTGNTVSDEKVLCADRLTVSFLLPAYEATWNYVTATARYVRYQDDAIHADSDGMAMVADTVIVQRVRARVLDEVGRLAITTVGSGQALIFREGQVVIGRWQKQSARSRTEWLDESGAPIMLSPGKIWIEVVPQDGRVTYEQKKLE